MNNTNSRGESEVVDNAAHFVDEAGMELVQPWEEIESGRFMPRRIRGSYRGRALG